jgi:hypothetical protein
MAGETQPVIAAFSGPPTMAWMPGTSLGMTGGETFFSV